MDSILTLLPFKERRAPLVDKVKRDSELMYQHSRYVIVVDEQGHVVEQHFNRRFDDDTVDCLTVFAPVTYRGVYIEKAVVLEIGFRRFVPYAQTEYRLNSSTRRGPSHRVKKGEIKKEVLKKQKQKAIAIKPRVPVAVFSKDAVFDLMPIISNGIQVCVDAIVLTWKGSRGATTVWAQAGNKSRKIWRSYEVEPAITVRIPSEMDLLCATATFAELEWRFQSDGQIDISARALKDMLKYYLSPSRRRGKNAQGNFSDEYVKGRTTFYWVADRLQKKVRMGYSRYMIEQLLSFVGVKGSFGRNLIEQIQRVYKVPKAQENEILDKYQFEYGEMKNLLLERWLVRNYQSLRQKTNKEIWERNRTSVRPYYAHAKNSQAFSIFASKKTQDEMAKAYDARKSNPHDPDEDDDDIPF